jgi:flagellar M-ring protein FliF
MVAEASIRTGRFSGQRRLFALVFAVLCLALAAGYYLFLRTDYAVLYTDLKPADASAIVAELDAKGTSHRLAANGTTILVPTDQADTVRLAVAGSDIPLKGSVGFELFNKSDMGLTDFAQKINYQRAIQGELSRTIMMMDAIESARVHLAIPERSLFRGNKSIAKAAVEVISKPGRPLTPDRVAGIQQLVASAVPDLALGEVVVLDGDGRIISQAPPTEATSSPEVEEQTAAQNYYSARAKTALGKSMPGLQFGVRTLVLKRGEGEGGLPALPSQADGSAAPSPGARNFQLRVTILTLAPMNPDDQLVARNTVVAAMGLDEQRGDNLAFEVGPIATPSPARALMSPQPATVTAGWQEDADTARAPAESGSLVDWWMVALATLVVAAAAIAARLWRPALSPEERNAFIGRVRIELGTGGSRDGF